MSQTLEVTRELVSLLLLQGQITAATDVITAVEDLLHPVDREILVDMVIDHKKRVREMCRYRAKQVLGDSYTGD